MLTKDEIETAVKNGMVFNRKPTEPVLTRKLFELLKMSYSCGYAWGNKCADKRDGFEEGFVELLNEYFGEPLFPFRKADDNGQK